ncbi:NEK1 [Bugula neritina]|uniref:non-specific serine/threonine protein kinase n=1 Tax=Bugula neritina TaxID=10212 RepID=A0A7J7KEU7_BUGNE|nr:NEK1 [Bugula neritina]
MDRYTIHKFLGYCHQFVIKTVPAKTLSPKEKEFALKEVKILSSLQHKNVVRFIDYFEENGTLHIVQEYCDGGELNVVNGTCMEEKKIWGYLAQICLGLKYLHSQKVLHRDLKPANIFLTKNDDLKLGDFGLSKKLPHSLAMTTSFVGTAYIFIS